MEIKRGKEEKDMFKLRQSDHTEMNMTSQTSNTETCFSPSNKNVIIM